MLEHIQSVPETKDLLTDSVGQFLAYHNLLGHALLFFLREESRSNKRFYPTLLHLQQEKLTAQNQQLLQATGQADSEQTLLSEQQALAEMPAQLQAQAVPVFEFEIVTVNAIGKISTRETKQARYETEDLGNGVTLDMVVYDGFA